LTTTDSQLDAVTALRSEIERIDRATRASTLDSAPCPGGGISYSFGLFTDASSFASVDQTVADIVTSVRATLAKLAPVYTLETSRDGLTVRTVIQYSGLVASVWSQGNASLPAAAGLAAAHLDSLQRTYALRIAFAGAIAAVGNTLVGVSMAMANPLTVLHALASAKALKLTLERLAAVVAPTG
jgi:hypothetical protein